MRTSLLLCVVIVVAGCGASQVRVAADPPPSAATWKAYPKTLPASCWGRSLGGGVLRNAPTVFPAPTHEAPARVLRAELAQFGDRRYVRSASLGPVPRLTLEHLRGYFAGKRPPADAVWAWISAPAANKVDVAQWEAELFGDGLRDRLCVAGGQPLAGFTVGRGGIQVSNANQAVAERFPSPSATAFRRRVALVGKKFGFHIESLRLLHPFQTAPLLVVDTSRNRKSFTRDVPAIMTLLDPVTSMEHGTAVTFEAFLFEARDANGPFVRVEDIYRGEVMGGEWSANPCDDPYPHSEPAGSKPCPS